MYAFEKYEKAKHEICQYFNCGGILGDIEIKPDEKWTDHGEECETVGWGGDDGDVYEAEIWGGSKWESDKYVMFCVCNDCEGETFLIFSKANKVTEEMKEK